MPFIGPFTGAEFLRAPELRSVVNIRASYSAEAEAWVKHLTEGSSLSLNIAIFYQDDSFGRDGLAGVKRAAGERRHGIERRRHVRSATPNSSLRHCGSSSARSRKPSVMIGTYGPCAEFIKLARKAAFIRPSSTSPSSAPTRWPGSSGRRRGRRRFPGGAVSVGHLAQGHRRLPGRPKGPLDPTSCPPGFVSLEGYLSGRLTVAALELAGPHPARADLLRTINEVGRFDISGSVITCRS